MTAQLNHWNFPKFRIFVATHFTSTFWKSYAPIDSYFSFATITVETFFDLRLDKLMCENKKSTKTITMYLLICMYVYIYNMHGLVHICDGWISRCYKVHVLQNFPCCMKHTAHSHENGSSMGVQIQHRVLTGSNQPTELLFGRFSHLHWYFIFGFVCK